MTNAGRTVAAEAGELGIQESTLGRRVNIQTDRQDGGDAPSSETKRAELARLRKENSELKLDWAFLEKCIILLRPGRFDTYAKAFELMHAEKNNHLLATVADACSRRVIGWGDL